MIIVMFILTIILTLVAGGICSYAAYITAQISGEKLLTLNSELGYKYATTYHSWQTASVISVAVIVVMWIIFIIMLLRRHKNKRRMNKNNGN